jgi:tryptophan synthase alpha chain
VRGSEKLKAAFLEGRAALVPYLTGGYPTLGGAYEVGEAYLEAEAGVVEIGVPFSDPLADGPTIQDTTAHALANGANLAYCLDLASSFVDRVPVVLLIYYNVVFAKGVERFLEDATGAGVSGLVIPDLPGEEAVKFGETAAEKGVAVCPLAAQTTSGERLNTIAKAASGFVYCVSVAGVTGAREELPSGAIELLRRVRARVGRTAPVALGFGISSAGAAVEAAAEADGVIIGSKLMQLVTEKGPEGAGAWLKDVREALDRWADEKASARVGSRD